MSQQSQAIAVDVGRSARVPGFTLLSGVHAHGSALPRHTHEDPTICFVLRGRFTEYSPGRALACEPDMLKVTPAGDPHWNRFDAGDTRGLRIDVDAARFDAFPAIRRLLDDRRHLRDAAVSGLARRLVRELHAADTTAQVAAEGLALELLAMIARTEHRRGNGAVPRWLAHADEMVRERFTDRISLADVAGAVGVHPVTLARAYRRAFGCSVGEQVRRLRVERAARDLLDSATSLAEVAAGAGFYDQSHFTHVFRQQIGCTPARYRALSRPGQTARGATESSLRLTLAPGAEQQRQR